MDPIGGGERRENGPFGRSGPGTIPDLWADHTRCVASCAEMSDTQPAAGRDEETACPLSTISAAPRPLGLPPPPRLSLARAIRAGRVEQALSAALRPNPANDFETGSARLTEETRATRPRSALAAAMARCSDAETEDAAARRTRPTRREAGPGRLQPRTDRPVETGDLPTATGARRTPPAARHRRNETRRPASAPTTGNVRRETQSSHPRRARGSIRSLATSHTFRPGRSTPSSSLPPRSATIRQVQTPPPLRCPPPSRARTSTKSSRGW